MCAEDWVIFRRYSRRVQCLSIQSSQTTLRIYNPIDRQVILALSHPPTILPLFPNLQRLDCFDSRDEILSFVRLVFGPKITHLSLSILEHDMSQLSLLPSVGVLCPSIRSVRFRLHGASLFQSQVMSDAVCKWDSIEKLDCGLLNEKALIHLAGLDSLRSLSCTVSQLISYPNSIGHGCNPTFPNLEDLSLTSVDSFVSFSSFFRSIRSLPKKLQFYLDEEFPSDELRDLLATLSTKSSHDNLQIIHIEELMELMSPRLHSTITIDTLRPLLSFSRLQLVFIDTLCPISLDDAALTEMAAAWPNLGTLSLNTDHGCRSQSHVTFKGLISLLKLCPKLHTLSMVVDTTILDLPKSGRPGGGVCNRNITELTLSDSKIEDSIKVASILSDILPCVKEICAWSSETLFSLPEAEGYILKWEEVGKLLRAFASVREEERAWKEDRSVVGEVGV
ncbi:hypothetical protein SERLADRAFT_433948 [Serpula lacrymans var. lacrymans S7.9]|uniref:F-box domain-containing protein n=1 Tax=Serpula lacrymans var. lacrymans (strain S7.9) TaxID=578457 RepID=F8NJG4_SERL9|nr:uncharacterized protein SERLADRAFT_433948 [Serpula lacrymans var. lacrymans S7.9]EGO30014.1 hypothetical protein SERLADRAFT_433948 [Serpula lacrymans var. lacrymans S7.9]